MPGPWEQYQAQQPTAQPTVPSQPQGASAPAGPWSQYAQTAQPQPEDKQQEQYSAIGNAAYGAGQFVANGPLGSIYQTGKQLVNNETNAESDAQSDLQSGNLSGFAGDAIKASLPGAQLAGQAIDASWQNAKQIPSDLQKGDLSSAWSSLVGSIPIAGPAIKEAGERLGNALAGDLDASTGKFHVDTHELSGALGQVAGLASQVVAPKIAAKTPAAAKAAIDTTKKLTESAMDHYSGAANLEPERLAMSALRGSVPQGATQFADKLPTAMSRIKQVAQESGVGKFDMDNLLGTQDKPGLIQAAKKANREQFNELLGRQKAMGSQIDLSPVADAMEKSVSPKVRLENPAYAKSIDKLAARYRGKFSIDQVDSFLKTTNAQLDSYYGENPNARSVDVRSNPKTAVLSSQAAKLRSSLYDYLDSPGMPKAAKALQQEWGSLNEFEESLYKRKNVMLRQAPLNLSSQVSRWSAIGDIAGGAWNLATSMFGGDSAAKAASGLQGIVKGMSKNAAAEFIQNSISTDTLLNKAFQKVDASGKISAPGAVKPKALLEAGPRRMPAGPVESDTFGEKPAGDTSGPMHFEPKRNPGYHDITRGSQKALPASNRGPDVPDLGRRDIEPVTDLVPVHTASGGVQYVHRSVADALAGKK